MSASVILSPNPANPHPNALGLPLGGELLQWGPFQMTNYYLDMYGGPGTVELIGPSSLVNSSFTLDGPSANLVNDGTMRLQQSQLTVGGSLAGYGSVIATQGSTIIAASSVPSQIFYLPGDPPPDQTVTAKSTYPSETITLQSSTLDIGSGVPSSAPGSPSNFFTAPVVMDAASTVNIEGNFTVANQNWGVYSLGGKLGTLNIADGPVTISGGIMQVNANMAQSNDPNNHFAHVEIFNGGRLMLAGSSSGGEIDITAGTLEFSRAPGFIHSPETASESFTSKLAFNGSSGAVQFDGIVGELRIGFNQRLNEIAVFNHGQKIADFHLGPASYQNPYSAANFSVRGNELLYHHS